MSNVDRSASATTRKLRSKAIVSFNTINPDKNLGGSSILSSGVLTELRGARVIFSGKITNFTANFFAVTSGNAYYPTYNLGFALSWDKLQNGTTVTITSNITSDLIVYSGIDSAIAYGLSSGNSTTKRIFTLSISSNDSLETATATAQPV